MAQPALDLTGWPEAESKAISLAGDDWSAWAWDVRVKLWPAPERWRSAVLGTLDQLLTAGVVACVESRIRLPIRRDYSTHK